ncbi:MAG: carbon storage regulator [Amnibacterium sp.]|nr:carbon storage regulator [Amnibacterium sp.]
MLVLTRKKGERILIGDDIVVTLIDIRGDGVRIGFDAPRGVPIQRAEVVTAVTEANTEAAATSAATGELLVGLLSRGRSTSPAGGQDRRPPTFEPQAAAPQAPAPQAAATEQPAEPQPHAEPRPVPKPGPRPRV